MEQFNSSFRNAPSGVFLKFMTTIILAILFFGFSTKLKAQQPATVDVLSIPESVNITVGETFSITVHIDPDGGSVTVADIRMSFNPEMIQIENISFASGTPLGYQNQGATIDNINGYLQYGGFGFSAATTPFNHITIECTALNSGMSFIEHVRIGQPMTIMAFAGYDVTDEVPAIPVNITIDEADCPELGVNNGDPCDIDGLSGEIVNCECLPFDCDGMPGGSASIDECGVCTGGTTGIEPNTSCLDCEGTPNGLAVEGSPCYIDQVLGTWDENCNCTPSYDCPELMANTGDACDDENAETLNDVVTENCECQGEIPASGNLYGSVNLNSNCVERTLSMDFYEPETSTLILSHTTTIDQNGNYMVMDISVGTYDIYAKIDGHLAKAFLYQNITEDNVLLNLGSFIHGDLDNSNGININDVSIISVAFGSSIGNVNYNVLADMNCDGNVNIIDISIISPGFGMEGAHP